MDSVLFIKTSSLGDVIHHMPAVVDARRAFPHLQLSWIVEEPFAPLVQLHPAVDEVISVATRRWRSRLLAPSTWSDISDISRRLRETGYDRIVDTQGLIRSAFIARRSQGERHGYDASSIKEPLASRFYDVTHRVSRQLHAVTRNRLLTAVSLGYEVTDAVDYGLPRAASRRRRALLLHGTSRTSKEWSEANWIDLGRWLRREGFDVALPWGNDSERRRAQRLASSIPEAEVLDRQPLDAVAAILAEASLAVGVDTGLLHLAAAYRVPTVGIFVGSDPALTGPLGGGPLQTVGGLNAKPTVNDTITAIERVLAG